MGLGDVLGEGVWEGARSGVPEGLALGRPVGLTDGLAVSAGVLDSSGEGFSDADGFVSMAGDGSDDSFSVPVRASKVFAAAEVGDASVGVAGSLDAVDSGDADSVSEIGGVADGSTDDVGELDGLGAIEVAGVGDDASDGSVDGEVVGGVDGEGEGDAEGVDESAGEGEALASLGTHNAGISAGMFQAVNSS